MSTFVFFHAGPDIEQPNRLVESIRKTNSDAEIVMASTPNTPEILGISRRVNLKSDSAAIMYLRVAGFAAAQVDSPAIYLDTDMVVKQSISPVEILGDKTAMLCRRSFNKNYIFNHNLRGIDFSEYEGMTIDEVYPYLACATVTRNWKPWAQMLVMMDYIHPKFMTWYGDQEVLRLYAASEADEVGFINESEYACLPEYESQFPYARIIHYKGGRK